MVPLGDANVVLAGGMEAMSQAPFVIRGRDGFSLAPGASRCCGEQQGVTRQAQDEFALRSQQSADAAYKDRRLQEELVLAEDLAKASPLARG